MTEIYVYFYFQMHNRIEYISNAIYQFGETKKYIIIKKMIRNITKNLVSLTRPFAFSSYKVKGNYPIHMKTSYGDQQSKNVSKDAERVFQQFFKQNPIKESEKSFFDMNYTVKQETFVSDPLRTLGLEPRATKQKIDQAYRVLAMKYHPKNDPSFEAAQKFIRIAQAYEKLNPKITSSEKKSSPSALSNLMYEFNQSVKQVLGQFAEVKPARKQKVEKANKVEIKSAQIFSQSKQIKKLGNYKQVRIEKQNNDNGILTKVTRIQRHNENGMIQIQQSFDNGQQVTTKNSLQRASKSHNSHAKTNTKNAQLYYEYKNVKKVGDNKIVAIEKQYNDNGKITSIRRVQKHRGDGSCEVEEALDNGVEIKSKVYMQGSQ